MSESARYHVERRTADARHNFTFVEPHEFLKLLLSRREMTRSDECDGKVRGLLDVQTGRRFLIRQDKLVQR
jgi:hypothetical protein